MRQTFRLKRRIIMTDFEKGMGRIGYLLQEIK